MESRIPEGYEEQILLDASGISELIEKLAGEIFSSHRDDGRIILLGIRTRGIYIAERIKKHLEKLGLNVLIGTIDITFYRDDLAHRHHLPEVRASKMPITDITGENIIIVDDVIFTGRTTRAAIDLVFDYGRPARIELAVLIDRGHRELPIQPDYVGLKIETRREDAVLVELEEVDGHDRVIIWRKK